MGVGVRVLRGRSRQDGAEPVPVCVVVESAGGKSPKAGKKLRVLICGGVLCL